MDREYLLSRLKMTKPGLSTSDLIPVMMNYWFDGSNVMTYNDQIGLSVPCETPFKGAVPGQLLWSMISGLGESSLPLECVEKDGLTIKYRRSMMKFPLLPPDSFLFKFPKSNSKAVIQPQDMAHLIGAIEICMKSAGDDSTNPETMGITVIPKAQDLLMFATDNATMIHARVKCKVAPSFTGRAILPMAFCQQVVSLAKGDDAAKLEINKDHALLSFGKGCLLFGRLIQSTKDIPFEETFARHVTKSLKTIAMPARLSEVLALSANITDGPSQDVFTQMKEVSRGGSTKTRITVKDGSIQFYSNNAGRGEYSDAIKLAKGTAHPDCPPILVSPKRVREGCQLFEDIAITEAAIIMVGKAATYLVSCAPAIKEKPLPTVRVERSAPRDMQDRIKERRASRKAGEAIPEDEDMPF